MLFNPDPTKPAQVIFSKKKKKKKKIQTHPINSQIAKVPYQKHLGILLDEKVNFKQHFDSAILKK